MPQISKKDLLMVHLLRVACTSRGPLADALPQITDELHELGVSLLDNCIFFIHRGKFLHFFPQNYVKPFQILSEEVLDLASKSSPDFNRTFEHAFNQNMVRIPWHTSLLLFTYLSFM